MPLLCLLVYCKVSYLNYSLIILDFRCSKCFFNTILYFYTACYKTYSGATKDRIKCKLYLFPSQILLYPLCRNEGYWGLEVWKTFFFFFFYIDCHGQVVWCTGHKFWWSSHLGTGLNHGHEKCVLKQDVLHQEDTLGICKERGWNCVWKSLCRATAVHFPMLLPSLSLLKQCGDISGIS